MAYYSTHGMRIDKYFDRERERLRGIDRKMDGYGIIDK